MHNEESAAHRFLGAANKLISDLLGKQTSLTLRLMEPEERDVLGDDGEVGGGVSPPVWSEKIKLGGGC